MKKTITFLFVLLLTISKTNGELLAQSPEEKFVGTLSETLGYQSVSGLFASYIAIGSLADSFASEIHTRENIMQVSKQLATLMQGTHEQFEVLLKDPILDESDREMVDTISKIYAILSIEANHLYKFAETGEKKYLNQFQKERKKAWNAISRMLQLD